jgi:HEPN domain-containing protein
MTKEEKFNYWLELGRYDLDTASAMYSTGRWFYVVFMCQQAIEKCCKGLYTLYLDDNVPKIHNINTIISRFKDRLPGAVNEDTLRFFDVLSAQYITYRYPDFECNQDRQTNENEAKQILVYSTEPERRRFPS